jgi:hypothetical protein
MYQRTGRERDLVYGHKMMRSCLWLENVEIKRTHLQFHNLVEGSICLGDYECVSFRTCSCETLLTGADILFNRRLTSRGVCSHLPSARDHLLSRDGFRMVRFHLQFVQTWIWRDCSSKEQ